MKESTKRTSLHEFFQSSTAEQSDSESESEPDKEETDAEQNEMDSGQPEEEDFDRCEENAETQDEGCG